AAADRTALGTRAAALIAAHLHPVAPGLYRLDANLFEAADRAAALYAFRIAAAMAGGTGQLAGLAAAEQAFLAVRHHVCATLSRAVFSVRKAGVHLHRERRNLPAVEGTGSPILWDGRYWLAAEPSMRIAPFGREAAKLPPDRPHCLPQDLLFSAQSAEPAFWRDDICLGPARGPSAAAGIAVPAPWARLLPSFDIAPANAVLTALGGKTVIPCHHPNTIATEA
ncbi:tRNA lysidine(34) synthetase TilS, partial [Nitratireductor sp. ZSWI3]|nr:tRNA lysidine(34) synthetase TilS [Nitratireductor sp. ZSWI3]